MARFAAVSQTASGLCATLTGPEGAAKTDGFRLRKLAYEGETLLSISERKKEIKRRRKRREQLVHLKQRLAKATVSERVEITRKLREMTPGAEVLVTNWELAEVDR